MVVAPRAYWKGYLKLSLVSCPIALYPASSSSERVSFRQINKKTGNRLRQQLVEMSRARRQGALLRTRQEHRISPRSARVGPIGDDQAESQASVLAVVTHSGCASSTEKSCPLGS